jgi:hypothetical protein
MPVETLWYHRHPHPITVAVETDHHGWPIGHIIRCPHCGWAWRYTTDETQWSVTTSRYTNATIHTATCHLCTWQVADVKNVRGLIEDHYDREHPQTTGE